MDKVLEKYSSVIQDKFNLFRLISFFFFLLFLTKLEAIEYKSYVEGLLRASIEQVFNLDEFKENVSIGMALVAIIGVSLGVWLFSGIAKGLMKKQTDRQDYFKKLDEIKSQFSFDEKSNIRDKIEMGKYIDECSAKIAVKVKFIYGLAEFLFVSSWVFFVAICWGGWIDFFAFVGCLILSFAFLIKSQIDFISKISGFLVAKSLLFGVDINKVFADDQGG